LLRSIKTLAEELHQALYHEEKNGYQM